MSSNSKGATRKRNLRRQPVRGKRGARQTKKSVLFLVQGQETERQYFENLRRERNWHNKVSITVDVCSEPPNKMAQRAEELLRDYDYVFVVCDVDEFSNDQFAQARGIAGRKRNRDALKLVVTYPKFDLWLCAHYQNMRAACDDAQVTRVEKQLNILQSRRGAKQNQRRKNLRDDFPYDRTTTAMSNVNVSDFGFWSEDGSTSLPKVIELVDGWNN